MDGVLLMSPQIHAEAFHAVLENEGIADKFSYELYLGRKTSNVFRDFYQALNIKLDEEKLKELTENKRRIANQRISEEFPVDNDLIQKLEKLPSSVTLSLASSASRKNVDLFLDKSGLRSRFGFTISGDEVENAKPNPEIFARCLQAVTGSAEEALVIEDSTAGIEAASRLGINSVGIEGLCTKEELENSGAKVVYKKTINFIEEYEKEHL